MIQRTVLESHLNNLLQPQRFKDYGPNGLQVEGKSEIRKVVSGVTACQTLIDAAIAAQADAIVVHHGLFWRGQDGRITGWMRQRLHSLLTHNINLFAYHLPLDAHPEWGNNIQLAVHLDLQAEARFGDQDLGCIGTSNTGAFPNAQALAQHVERRLNHSVVCVPGRDTPIQRIAWCTGGAQSYFEAAIAAGAEAFITGEISEPQAHYARECGVAYLACGHHATERYGAPALTAHLAAQLGFAHQFIDIDNPA